MNFDIPRFGFACKFMLENPSSDKKKNDEIIKLHNFKGTTLTSIKKLDKKEQFKKVFDIIVHNLNALENLFKYLETKPKNLRMMRIGSDIFPFYTLEDFYWIYQDQTVKNYYQNKLKKLGDFAKSKEIRLSSHPGQYTILNSNSSKVLENSIKDFEYHCDVFRLMGYSGWHDEGIEVNIHGGSKNMGLEPLMYVIKTKLSKDAKDWISIENCEYCFGVEDLKKLSDMCALVLDVHHHFVHSKGEYISPNDKRIEHFISSWRGVKPEMHYSISPEYIFETVPIEKPIYEEMIKNKISRTKIRQHSDQVWNYSSNKWVLSFSEKFDIMVEAKHKNLSSIRLFNQYLKDFELK